MPTEQLQSFPGPCVVLREATTVVSRPESVKRLLRLGTKQAKKTHQTFIFQIAGLCEFIVRESRITMQKKL